MTLTRRNSHLLVLSLALLLGACAPDAGAPSRDRSADDAEIDEIYRAFMADSIDLELIEGLYREDIIHVGQPGTDLIAGKARFMETNIVPLADVVNSGQLNIDGRAYIVRREIHGDMANDVGYLFASISEGDSEPVEVVQKFSWVFIHDGTGWRVITDFDGMPAELSVLDRLTPQRIVE